jgi:glycerol-3-phosphate dehydrogenase
MSSIADKAARLAELRAAVNELEKELTDEIVALGRSQTVDIPGGRMVMSYRKPRAKVNYEAVAMDMEVSNDLKRQYTESRINWSHLVKDHKEGNEDLIELHTTYGNASVTLKVELDEEHEGPLSNEDGLF